MPASDIPDIMIPQEDGAIQEALADLDRKLALHVAAVREAEARLREIVQPTAAPAPQSLAGTAVAEEEPAPAEADVAHVPPQRLKGRSRTAPAEPVEPAPPSTEPVEPAAPMPAPLEPVETATPTEPAAAPAGLSEDDALLASLDEATSKAIRVMRRLNPNRSVQELLKQVEKQRDAASSAPKPAAKSWFRRK